MSHRFDLNPLALAVLLLGSATSAFSNTELFGDASVQIRTFANDPLSPVQEDDAYSLAIEPEFAGTWNEGDTQFVFKPFARYDSADDERSHADIRELYFLAGGGDLNFKIGIGREFWGVTESQHLVDIINQVDLIENLDFEDRLGQPMVKLGLQTDIGNFEIFALPYFRERTFPGVEGRLRPDLIIDIDNPIYESSADECHLDFAVRWSHYVGNWDIGLAHFSGTSREPIFVPAVTKTTQVLRPFYQQIDQSSLDLQATLGDWLWKLEAIYNQNNTDDFFAAVGGFEYTFVGVFGGRSDLGVLVEYHYDERDERSTTGFDDDWFAGMRWSINDAQSSELLVGAVVDANNQGTFVSIEGSRRLGNAWTIAIEARGFSNYVQGDLFFDLRDDDYLEIELSYHY